MSGLGENDVVPKRILRPRGKKAVDMKIEVESLNCKRNLRSSKKEVAEKEVVVGGSSINGSSEADNKQDDHEVVKETGPDSSRWSDLEKMTLGDFFDYLEVQLPKEIYEKSEKIIADLEEKARKCNELRLKRN